MVDRLLDLPPGIGQVSSTTRYEVLTENFEVIGEVHPEMAPTITNDVTKEIMRTMSGFVLPEHEAVDLNPLVDRIRPVWILEDAREWNMGVFLFVDDETDDDPYHFKMSAELYDQHHLLSFPLIKGASLSKNGDVLGLMIRLATRAGVRSIFVDEVLSGEVVHTGQDIIYFAGDIPGHAMKNLAAQAGILPPYFDKDGQMQIRPIPELEDAEGLLRYSTDDLTCSRIISKSSKFRRNLLKAPNVFVVSNSGSTVEAIVGVAYIDPNMAHSRENRNGLEVVNFERIQGVENTRAAVQMAKARAKVSAYDYAEIEFAGPPDPRHDSFQIIVHKEEIYREVRWSVEMRPGASMKHSCNRAGVVDNRGI